MTAISIFEQNRNDSSEPLGNSLWHRYNSKSLLRVVSQQLATHKQWE
jgi:hypothetical protein